MGHLIPGVFNRFSMPIDDPLTIEGGPPCRDAGRDTSSGPLNDFCGEIPSGYPRMKALLTSLHDWTRTPRSGSCCDPDPAKNNSKVRRVGRDESKVMGSWIFLPTCTFRKPRDLRNWGFNSILFMKDSRSQETLPPAASFQKSIMASAQDFRSRDLLYFQKSPPWKIKTKYVDSWRERKTWFCVSQNLYDWWKILKRWWPDICTALPDGTCIVQSWW